LTTEKLGKTWVAHTLLLLLLLLLLLVIITIIIIICYHNYVGYLRLYTCHKTHFYGIANSVAAVL
jgi:hypothetical protein